jgi:transcriptional regulator with XRE-family HTH domain
VQLGKKIRDLRLRRGMTVQQLAAASDLSKGFISQVENEHTSPSLATLQDLARALETSVAYLVLEEDQVPFVVRSKDRRRLSLSVNSPGIEVLSASPKRNLEVLIAELPAGVPAGDQRHHHHGEECVLCMEGRVTLTLGENTLALETGDSCHFDGRVPHAFENAGDTLARVLIAITPAAFEPVSHARGARAAATSAVVEVASAV